MRLRENMERGPVIERDITMIPNVKVRSPIIGENTSMTTKSIPKVNECLVVITMLTTTNKHHRPRNPTFSKDHKVDLPPFHGRENKNT